ncbi:hypothetical protein ABGB12_13420 [Actinocorallia sp. B10E7]|uniref:hypothetical protein n=1 Tax=Actinocorallia sp. B10E7 TaxID=3153558 RepID=UPI00325C7E74
MSDEQNSPGPDSSRWLPLGAAAGAVLAVTLLLQTGPGGSVLHGLGLAEKPPSFTEMSFLHPRELPARITTGQAPAKAEFEIRNRTGEKQVYRWVALAVRGRTEVRLGTGSVTLADGERTTVKPPAARCTPGPVHYVIRLETRRESLGFHADCEAA